MFELSIFLRDHLIGRSTFNKEEVRIGRSADNEVQIDNLALSRYHASIETIGGVHVLKDFGSQNGTWVNGEKVEVRRALNDGDRITLGKFVLLFRADKAEAPTVAPDVRDQAAFAVAGNTIVSQAAAVPREKPCPWVAYLEAETGSFEKGPVHPLARDFTVVGSASINQIVVDKAPERAAIIVRAWNGFQLVTISPQVKRNGEPVDTLVTPLKNMDELTFGAAKYRYHVGKPESGP